MKLTKPRMAAGGAVTPEELVKYLYKLVGEAEAELEEIRKKAEKDRKELENIISDRNAVPSKILQTVEALSAQYGDLHRQVQRNANNIVALQMWRESFVKAYNEEIGFILTRLDALEK